MVSGEAGCAVMRAVAGLWGAASAAATAGRMEGMSSGHRLEVGPTSLAARRPDLVGSGGRGRRGAVVFAFWARLGRGPAMREVVWSGVRRGKQLAWAAWGGRGGWAWGSKGVWRGTRAGHWAGWACCGAWGSLRWVCASCLVWGVVGGVRWVGPLRASAVVWAGGEGPCRDTRGCARWWACVGSRLGNGGGAGAGDCAGGCAVSVYVSACSGALVWSLVGRAVRRRSLPSSAAGARMSQMSVSIWCTSWSAVGRGYASSGLRPTRQRILCMAWYSQVRECCGLGGVLPCVWACFDSCVGGGDGPDPGQSPCGWPGALDSLRQAEYGQSQVIARPP